MFPNLQTKSAWFMGSSSDPCWVALVARMLLKREPDVAHLHAHSYVLWSVCPGLAPQGAGTCLPLQAMCSSVDFPKLLC